MKIDHQTISPAGNPVLTFRVGVKEIKIIHGLLLNALKHTPRTEQTTETIQRMSSMRRTLQSTEVQGFLGVMPEA